MVLTHSMQGPSLTVFPALGFLDPPTQNFAYIFLLHFSFLLIRFHWEPTLHAFYHPLAFTDIIFQPIWSYLTLVFLRFLICVHSPKLGPNKGDFPLFQPLQLTISELWLLADCLS